MERKVKLCYETQGSGDVSVQIMGRTSAVLAAISCLAYCLHTRSKISESAILDAVAKGLYGDVKTIIDENTDITEINMSHPIRKDEGK